VELTYSLNWSSDEEFTSHLPSRVTFTPHFHVHERAGQNPRAPIPKNIRCGGASPRSELFVVYNEQRDTEAVRFPDLVNRAFIVKINRLFRF
jgi:hypothetical protein